MQVSDNSRGNLLKELPASIGNLVNLVTLLMDSNPLKEIPRVVGRLLKLTDLHLPEKLISNLPRGVTRAKVELHHSQIVMLMKLGLIDQVEKED